MASAPERISIKRRRGDDPVDHLLYQSKKQRTSNHIFVRLAPSRESLLKSLQHRAYDSTAPASGPPINGIPVIKTTQPGDEVKDFHDYRTTHGLLRNTGSSSDKPQKPHSIQEVTNPRKFHLTRDLSVTLRPQQSTSLRKPKTNIRPHLPTFIERLQANSNDPSLSYAQPPIDRIIEPQREGNEVVPDQHVLKDGDNVVKHNVPTFGKPPTPTTKTGRSIHDDPATWDIESDELADELAALALEMDPDAQPNDGRSTHIAKEIPLDRMRIDEPEEYIYETYVRLEQDAMEGVVMNSDSNSFGYLVIDDEEEDLWEQYLRDDDDDDDWDDEDEDSNAEDNPRNEYPDEDLSSDDERGMNVYKYRQYRSDDEQFDERDL